MLLFIFVGLLLFLHQGVLGQPTTPCNRPTQGNIVPADNPCIHYAGRVALSGGTASFDWSGVEFTFSFEGTSVSLVLSGGNQNEYNVTIDGVATSILVIKSPNSTPYTIASGLSNTVHKITVSKRTEAFFGVQVLQSIVLDTNKWLQPTSPFPTRKLEFIGDSITCGYGDEGIFPCSFSAQTENNIKSYTSLVGEHFNAEVYVECWSGKGLVRNYGDKNITSPDPLPSYYNQTLASINNSPNWDFSWKPDGVVINLGTNDFSTQPYPPVDIFTGAYKTFITYLRYRYGNNVQLFLVCGPMIGNPCCQYVNQVVQDNQPNVHYVDLEGIIQTGDIGCDYHPNWNGHIKMADRTTPIISSALNWN